MFPKVVALPRQTGAFKGRKLTRPGSNRIDISFSDFLNIFFLGVDKKKERRSEPTERTAELAAIELSTAVVIAVAHVHDEIQEDRPLR